jgi:hypothetical protein
LALLVSVGSVTLKASDPPKGPAWLYKNEETDLPQGFPTVPPDDPFRDPFHPWKFGGVEGGEKEKAIENNKVVHYGISYGGLLGSKTQLTVPADCPICKLDSETNVTCNFEVKDTNTNTNEDMLKSWSTGVPTWKEGSLMGGALPWLKIATPPSLALPSGYTAESGRLLFDGKIRFDGFAELISMQAEGIRKWLDKYDDASAPDKFKSRISLLYKVAEFLSVVADLMPTFAMKATWESPWCGPVDGSVQEYPDYGPATFGLMSPETEDAHSDWKTHIKEVLAKVGVTEDLPDIPLTITMPVCSGGNFTFMPPEMSAQNPRSILGGDILAATEVIQLVPRHFFSKGPFLLTWAIKQVRDLYFGSGGFPSFKTEQEPLPEFGESGEAFTEDLNWMSEWLKLDHDIFKSDTGSDAARFAEPHSLRTPPRPNRRVEEGAQDASKAYPLHPYFVPKGADWTGCPDDYFYKLMVEMKFTWQAKTSGGDFVNILEMHETARVFNKRVPMEFLADPWEPGVHFPRKKPKTGCPLTEKSKKPKKPDPNENWLTDPKNIFIPPVGPTDDHAYMLPIDKIRALLYPGVFNPDITGS